MAGQFATQFIAIFRLCINTTINQTGQHHRHYLSIVDQTVGSTLLLQASASHGQAIVLSAQSRLFQLHLQNFKADNRTCNTFLSILLLTCRTDVNHNLGPEVALE